MAKAKRRGRPPIPDDEKQQLRARKLVGHEFAIGKDEHGRDRLATADRRQFDIGSMKSVVRVRNVDPLAGMSSLSWQQRKAGGQFREDYETIASEGVKTGSWEIRVDGGGGERDQPERVAAAHDRMAKALLSLRYGEIRRTVICICGEGMSVKSLAEQDRNPRDVVAYLLGMGLDRLAVDYGIVTRPK